MKDKGKNIRLKEYELVIFDIDGTLYNQKKLRLRMMMDIFIYYLLKPHKVYELKILKIFREEREKKKGINVENLKIEQYRWVSLKTSYSIDIIKEVVEKWIYLRPLKHLLKYKFKGLDRLLSYLNDNKIKVAIYSDYPTKSKLEALQIQAKMQVASTDKEINALKPNPKGLLYIVKKFNIDTRDCLFIGDREVTDGKCANNAKMDYIIIDKYGHIYEDLLLV